MLYNIKKHWLQSIGVVAIAVIGGVALLASRAATPTASFEAESGAQMGTFALSDATASGGHAVKFSGSAVPSITSFTPGSIPDNGGTTLTVVGANFAAGAMVFVGSSAATAVSVLSSTQLTAVTPDIGLFVGTADLTVKNPNGQLLTDHAALNVTYPPPSFVSMTPTSGPASGGTQITVTGFWYINGETVTIGGLPAINLVVGHPVNSGSVYFTATTPPHAPGPVDIVVTNPDGTVGTFSGVYTYTP